MPNGSGGHDHSIGWQVLEDQSFETALAQFQNPRGIDSALASIDLGLHRNPKEWPAVPGFPGVHLAKTKLHLDGAEIIPSYLLWFRVMEDIRQVHLLWIEINPPDRTGFPDDEDNLDIDF